MMYDPKCSPPAEMDIDPNYGGPTLAECVAKFDNLRNFPGLESFASSAGEAYTERMAKTTRTKETPEASVSPENIRRVREILAANVNHDDLYYVGRGSVILEPKAYAEVLALLDPNAAPPERSAFVTTPGGIPVSRQLLEQNGIDTSEACACGRLMIHPPENGSWPAAEGWHVVHCEHGAIHVVADAEQPNIAPPVTPP